MVALTKAKRRLAAAGDDVREKVGPALGDVRDKLTPSMDMPHVTLKPALKATGRVLPAVRLATAAQKRRTRKAAVKVRLVQRPSEHHPIRTLLLVTVLGGIGYLAYRRFFGGDGDQWVETGDGGRPVTVPPVTPSTPEPAAPAAPAAAAEPAPTAPLASEETVESPVPTTPDEPFSETKVGNS